METIVGVGSAIPLLMLIPGTESGLAARTEPCSIEQVF